MKIIVTDRESIQRGIVVRSSYVVISISDPRTPKARIRKVSALKDVLYLSFSDASPVPRLKLPPEIRLMTAQQAREIWAFVGKYKDRVGAVVVHCHQGMSRSPAVAAAIAAHFGLDASPFHLEYQPNNYIYRLMLDVLDDPGT